MRRDGTTLTLSGPVTLEDPFLPVQRKSIDELRGNHIGESPRGGNAPRYHSRSHAEYVKIDVA